MSGTKMAPTTEKDPFRRISPKPKTTAGRAAYEAFDAKDCPRHPDSWDHVAAAVIAAYRADLAAQVKEWSDEEWHQGWQDGYAESPRKAAFTEGACWAFGKLLALLDATEPAPTTTQRYVDAETEQDDHSHRFKCDIHGAPVGKCLDCGVDYRDWQRTWPPLSH